MQTHLRPAARALSALLFLSTAACEDGSDDPIAAEPSGASAPDGGSVPDASRVADSGNPFADCSRGTLEQDFGAAPLAGVGVVDGKLRAGSYVISATYLQLRQDPAAQQRFGELMGPIMADLQTRKGLVAISLGTSSRCGVARTLSVWEDDIAMFGFVASEAHGAAVSSVKQVSRGGSLVTHWTGDAAQATWSAAAEHAGQDDGPLY